MSQAVLNKILDGKIIAIVRGIPSEKIVDLVNAMLKGGVYCVEVTFDQSSEEAKKDTLKAISTITKEFGEQVHQAVEAGAEYIISTNTDEEVIKETKKLGKVSIPGAMTPTEAAFAYKCGADIVKLFPAGVLGAAYIKALKAPLKHIPVTAVGSVNPQNCAEFIKAGCVGVGCGGNLVSAKLVNEGRFDEITAVAKEYMEALSNC